MKITRLPAVDPSVVRAQAGFNPNGTWYSPRKRRPAAFKVLHGSASADVREVEA